MGTRDILTNTYMRRNDVLADVFNYRVYDGRQVLHPEDLHDLDPTEAYIAYGEDEDFDKTEAVKKERDILKAGIIKEDDKATYIILGAEDQSYIDPTMPARNMMYNSLQYDKQIRAIRHFNKHANDGYKPDPGEFLSGFRRTDRLKPVITLVVYWGNEEWKKPLSLYDMMDPLDSRLQACVQNYKIFVVQPAVIPDADLDKLQSDFRFVAECIQASRDGKRMKAFISGSSPDRMISRDARLVVNAYTGMKFDVKEENIKMSVMYPGWQEMMEEERAKGREEGEACGIALGKLYSIYDLVLAKIISPGTGAKQAGKSEEEFLSGLEDYRSSLN